MNWKQRIKDLRTKESKEDFRVEEGEITRKGVKILLKRGLTMAQIKTMGKLIK